MATCRFCGGTFQSEQAVKAHLKTCDQYKIKKHKKPVAALGTKPKAAAATPVQASLPEETPHLAAPLLDVLKSLRECSMKQDEPQTSQQQRRTILQAVKQRVIGQYVTFLGQVTTSMRGHAKLMIEKQLTTLPTARRTWFRRSLRIRCCHAGWALRLGLQQTRARSRTSTSGHRGAQEERNGNVRRLAPG